MEWTDKGHEYDKQADELSKKWKKTNCIYLFGAGGKGKFYKRLLDKYKLFSGYIDNNSDKWSEQVSGLEDFVKNNDCGWIVLCAGNAYVREMRIQIDALELDKESFFIYDADIFFERIFPVISAYELGKIFDNLCQISVTERCTLKCEKCAHGCWNTSMDQEDLSLEDVTKSADNYFNAFDYVVEFVLIGGEPFLYKNLDESIRYIGEHYRDKIIIFSITTNGTILPSKEVIEACKECGVHIHISNYVKTLPRLRNSYERLCAMLDANDISYDLSNEDDKWVDYGFDSFVRSDEEDLKVVFDKCRTPCREVRGNKYYFCVQARAVGENMSFDVGGEDYLDLSEIKSKDGKKILMEFGMGYSDKGYLDMCKYCYGAEAVDRIIPRAIQKRDE